MICSVLLNLIGCFIVIVGSIRLSCIRNGIIIMINLRFKMISVIVDGELFGKKVINVMVKEIVRLIKLIRNIF